MVEVFKTDIDTVDRRQIVLRLLRQTYPGFKINLDLDDCDRVLRVEGDKVLCHSIINLVQSTGAFCEELEDIPLGSVHL